MVMTSPAEFEELSIGRILLIYTPNGQTQIQKNYDLLTCTSRGYNLWKKQIIFSDIWQKTIDFAHHDDFSDATFILFS